MNNEPWQLDASALAEMLANGTIDPVDLCELYQRRIQQLNPILNAVVCHNAAARADAEASALRWSNGAPLSRIDGLPILIKDNLVVRDLPATWGSALYKHFIPTHDEIPVEKLRAAGAIILGKTNVPEFTLEGYTDNKLFGLTPNPWNLSLTPGGSSGGSVAAVAAGIIPWSIGTDGGGSIRRPAAYTNLVGLKPSIGRIARGGGLPQLLLDMEVVGAVTRSVRDQVLMLEILAGPDVRDHRSLRLTPLDRGRHLARPGKELRILAVECFGDAPLDPIIRDSFRQMLSQLSNLGHRVESGVLPLDTAAINEHWAAIGQIGLALLMENQPGMRTLASPKYVEWAQTHYSAAHQLRISEAITTLRNQAAAVFDSIDIIMTPTCAAMPWSTQIPFPPEIDGQAVGPRGSAIYTGWVNACGHPAISIPGAMSENGLPIGIQLVGGFGRDTMLLQLSQQLESANEWTAAWPDLASSTGHFQEV